MDTSPFSAEAEPGEVGVTEPGGERVAARSALAALSALSEGARRVLRLWPALLLMLLGTLLSAGLLALVPALNVSALANRPAIARMAAGVPAWQIIDLFGLTGGAVSAGSPGAGNNSLISLLLAFVAMPVVGGVVSAFLYGGVLLTYKENVDDFDFARFVWGCWRWFGAYLAVGLVQALLFLVLYLPLAGLLIFLFSRAPGGVWAGIAVTLVLGILWLAIFELARVRLVLDGTRNPFRALGQAFRDLFGCPLPVLVFYDTALLILLAVHAIFRLGINPRVPLDALLLAVAVQQGFILVRLFCQALRLAGLMVMLR
jgi:hypothetical protein